MLGGNEEIMKLKEIVDNIFSLVKRIILTILENSFPRPMGRPMPFPVMNTILSYLLSVKGAGNIGLVSSDEVKDVERSDMEKLYHVLAVVYVDVKAVMFDIDPLVIIEPSMKAKKAILVENFEILVATVNRSQLQLSFEGLDIEQVEAVEIVK